MYIKIDSIQQKKVSIIYSYLELLDCAVYLLSLIFSDDPNLFVKFAHHEEHSLNTLIFFGVESNRIHCEKSQFHQILLRHLNTGQSANMNKNWKIFKRRNEIENFYQIWHFWIVWVVTLMYDSGYIIFFSIVQSKLHGQNLAQRFEITKLNNLTNDIAFRVCCFVFINAP